jgi:hypothetical protein
MEKLAGLGLVQVQPTRPKMFAALPSEVVVARIVEMPADACCDTRLRTRMRESPGRLPGLFRCFD